jgi:hypothetical protein
MRLSIATMEDTTQQTVSHALLTNFPITIKRRRWAEEPVIMECLYNGNTFIVTDLVHGRRDHHEGIVDVDHIRFESAQDAAHGNLAIRCRDDPAYQT